jgi:hypothetical protein
MCVPDNGILLTVGGNLPGDEQQVTKSHQVAVIGRFRHSFGIDNFDFLAGSRHRKHQRQGKQH